MGWRRIAWALLALAVVSAGAALGRWQLGRAAQKEATAAAIATQAARPPLAAGAVLLAGPEAVQRRASVRGRWLAEYTVLLDNRPQNGRAGLFVLTPLALDGGGTLLVLRGWLPRNFVDRQAVLPFSTPPGAVEVQGRLVPPPSKLLELGDAPAQAAPGRIRHNLDLDAYRRETGLAMPPLVLLQSDPATADGLQRDWPAPTTGVDKHYGYAFQWFGLSALAAFLYVWFHFIRPRRRRG
jgi:surfeit locus 1 family protein